MMKLSVTPDINSTRKAVYRLYSAAIALLFAIAIWAMGLERGDYPAALIYFVGMLIMILNFRLLKKAALFVSALSVFCFLIAEVLPQWDATPSMPVNHVRIVGSFFLLPVLMTLFCWKVLR